MCMCGVTMRFNRWRLLQATPFALALLFSFSTALTVAAHTPLVSIGGVSGKSLSSGVRPQHWRRLPNLADPTGANRSPVIVPGCGFVGREDSRALPALRHSIRCDVPPGGLPPLLKISPSEPPAPVPAPTPDEQPAPSPDAPPSSTDVDASFRYHPPGDLLPQDAGRGRIDRRVWLPNIIFPIKLRKKTHAHMNSQIWGYGGGGWGGRGAAGGGECDPRNYNPLVQRDNYCEVRGHSMPLCPAGRGHQGQDIRPPSCKDNTWDVVAVVDGIINMVTPNTTVRLKGADGTLYRYLHMHPKSITVRVGQRVKQGDVLGRVSRYMSKKIQTTRHLHFDVRQRIKIGTGRVRDVYVPVYASLIAAYRKAKNLNAGVDENGTLIPDHRYEIGVAPPQPKPPQPPTPQPEPPKPEPPQPPTPQPEPPKPEPPKPEPPQPPTPVDDTKRTWLEWYHQTITSWGDEAQKWWKWIKPS